MTNFITVRLLEVEGTPKDVILEVELQKIPGHWKKLGRWLLENGEKAPDAIDKVNGKYSEKAYKMLLRWKETEGSGATSFLSNSLFHH